MTASFLDAQVLQLPTSYRKEAVTGSREQNGNAALSEPNAKRYSIVKEQCPQLRAEPPRSGLVQQLLYCFDVYPKTRFHSPLKGFYYAPDDLIRASFCIIMLF